MNKQAADHLTKARDLITRADSLSTRSDDYYHKAVDEILAAKSLDPTLTQVAIAEKVGKGTHWVAELLKWDKEGRVTISPKWKRGSHATNAEIKAGVLKYLKDNPTEVAKEVANSPELTKAISNNKKASSGIIQAHLETTKTEYAGVKPGSYKDKRDFITRLDDLHVKAMDVGTQIYLTLKDELPITDDEEILEQAQDLVDMTIREFSKKVKKAYKENPEKELR